jgi:DNA (cytosine-5)-methyltransferase 1
LNELALFAGAGGGILGGQLLGWRTVCAVERDAYAATILAQRQNEGLLDLFPIWSDITTFDGRPWKGIVDVVSGGFPCQDISVAGKGAGINGERSGLWGEMERIIGEVRPRFVFVENSPALTLRGLGRVLGDLVAMGYDAEWGVLGAADVGAPHKRERIWIMGYTRSDGWDTRRDNHGEHDRTVSSANGQDSGILADTGCIGSTSRSSDKKGGEEGFSAKLINGSEDMADAPCLHDGCRNTGEGKRQIQQSGICSCKADVADSHSKKPSESGPSRPGWTESCDGSISGERTYSHDWAAEPDVGRVANGVAFRVDRLKGLGNGQVPECAAEAWIRLLARV